MRAIALGVLLAFSAEQSAAAQPRSTRGAIDGVVTDTGLVSLADANVSVLGSSVHVVTGANGRFRIVNLAPGQYIVVVHRIGYVPVSASMQIAEHDTVRTAFALERIANALDTVVVTAKAQLTRMGDFEARRTAGFGHFITQAEIDKRGSVFFSDLLINVLGVKIQERGLQQYAVNTRSGCLYEVFVDDVKMPSRTNLLDLPSPKELAGVEIYSSPGSVPLQYKAGGDRGMFCGTILVWTKIGRL